MSATPPNAPGRLWWIPEAKIGTAPRLTVTVEIHSGDTALECIEGATLSHGVAVELLRSLADRLEQPPARITGMTEAADQLIASMQPGSTRSPAENDIELAAAWAGYRNEYGVEVNEMALCHATFNQGWQKALESALVDGRLSEEIDTRNAGEQWEAHRPVLGRLDVGAARQARKAFIAGWKAQRGTLDIEGAQR